MSTAEIEVYMNKFRELIEEAKMNLTPLQYSNFLDDASDEMSDFVLEDDFIGDSSEDENEDED